MATGEGGETGPLRLDGLTDRDQTVDVVAAEHEQGVRSHKSHSDPQHGHPGWADGTVEGSGVDDSLIALRL